MRHKAILKLYPECIGITDGVGAFDKDHNLIELNETLIEQKINELKNAEPMRVLREERNRKLAETDWWCCSDRTPTQDQLDYRTALRDLPANSTPSLDENGQITNVTWPTKPE